MQTYSAWSVLFEIRLVSALDPCPQKETEMLCRPLVAGCQSQRPPYLDLSLFCDICSNILWPYLILFLPEGLTHCCSSELLNQRRQRLSSVGSPVATHFSRDWFASVITFTTRGGRQKVHSAGLSSCLRCDHDFGAVCLLWSRSHQKKTDCLPSSVQNSHGLVLQRCECDSQTQTESSVHWQPGFAVVPFGGKRLQRRYSGEYNKKQEEDAQSVAITLHIVVQLAFIQQIFHISVHLDNVTHFHSLYLTVHQNRNGTQLI